MLHLQCTPLTNCNNYVTLYSVKIKFTFLDLQYLRRLVAEDEESSSYQGAVLDDHIKTIVWGRDVWNQGLRSGVVYFTINEGLYFLHAYKDSSVKNSIRSSIEAGKLAMAEFDNYPYYSTHKADRRLATLAIKKCGFEMVQEFNINNEIHLLFKTKG